MLREPTRPRRSHVCSSDLSHRKSTTTAGVSHEHPPHVFPATTHRPQPGFSIRHKPHTIRTGIADTAWHRGWDWGSTHHVTWTGGRSDGRALLGRHRAGPGARGGRVTAPWLCSSASAMLRAERVGVAAAVATDLLNGLSGCSHICNAAIYGVRDRPVMWMSYQWLNPGPWRSWQASGGNPAPGGSSPSRSRRPGATRSTRTAPRTDSETERPRCDG